MTVKSTGLEGVVVGDSRICAVDGQAGQLIYRGYDIHDLAANCCFEEVAHLLWYGSLPNRSRLRETAQALAAHRALSTQITQALSCIPNSTYPMATLRTAVSALGMYDPRAEADAHETNISLAIELTSQMASLVAAIHRLRSGLLPVPPEPRLSHAANFLYMLTGERPDPLREEVFDHCLVLHLEHEMNASTFAARVTASTLSDIYSAITSAIGVLRGPLHGGANQRVMEMLDEIGEPARARPYVEALLAAKNRVMGFGHRVYRTEDPRAAELRRWCRVLGERTSQTKWSEVAGALEEVMLEVKQLHCNVDFYAAPVYHMLGIPSDLFPAIFAAARVVGWTAHVLEQYQDNRLIRPLLEYAGPRGLKVAPIEARG